jgi:hypothetical protein
MLPSDYGLRPLSPAACFDDPPVALRLRSARAAWRRRLGLWWSRASPRRLAAGRCLMKFVVRGRSGGVIFAAVGGRPLWQTVRLGMPPPR